MGLTRRWCGPAGDKLRGGRCCQSYRTPRTFVCDVRHRWMILWRMQMTLPAHQAAISKAAACRASGAAPSCKICERHTWRAQSAPPATRRRPSLTSGSCRCWRCRRRRDVGGGDRRQRHDARQCLPGALDGWPCTGLGHLMQAHCRQAISVAWTRASARRPKCPASNALLRHLETSH